MAFFSSISRVLELSGSGAKSNIAETEVQLAIRRGDAARDRQQWRIASDEYRAAVAGEDELPHIWVQLGHALKEQQDLIGAMQAYQKAVILFPQDSETHVHLAHVFKRLAQYDRAIVHFLSAFHFGLESLTEERELLHLLAGEVNKGRSWEIRAWVGELDRLPAHGEESLFLDNLREMIAWNINGNDGERRVDDGGPVMVFDISDLIGFWDWSRLPTGIQRVQIEVIESALERHDLGDLRLICFIDGRDDWLEVPARMFQQLASLTRVDGRIDDKEWLSAKARLDVQLSLARPFVFPVGALLINLGTSWMLQNYFLYVRQAKQTRKIRYVPFVHDLIPVMLPGHHTLELTQDFINWALGVFDHADHFLVNSQNTRSDLLKVADRLGHPVDPEDVAVIPLDSDFRRADAAELADEVLGKWHLEPGNFVLFVSTVESRKGHFLAFEAWSRMIAELGADNVPQLVCVGSRGWLNGRVYERLATDSVLARKVTMLSGLPDPELTLLYRTCRFTIYPSLYEGWGLPVTESLCYGKVPLISDAASLPEAGGEFAVYFASGSADEFERAARRLLSDGDYRDEIERRIATEFRPRSWGDMSKQMIDQLVRFFELDNQDSSVPAAPVATPLAQVGFWHPLRRQRESHLWPGMSSGEKYRSNLGWHWPDERGCRVKDSGGELTMRIPGPHGPLRMMIGLRSDDHQQARYSIVCGACRQEGAVEPNALSWVWLDIPASHVSHEIRIDLLAHPNCDGHCATYVVKGFHILEAENEQSRRDFVEAVTLNRLDLLDVFSERRELHLASGPIGFGELQYFGPRIKVYQTADADNYAEMLNITSRANRRYCERYGIEFETFLGIKRGYFPWHAAFNRIIYLKEQMDAGYDGWILYLDADAYVYGQGCDVRDLIKGGDGDFYFAPGGGSGKKWDVNDGVFIINLGSSAARELIDAWYENFMETPDEVMQEAHDWYMIKADQQRLHEILMERPDLLDRLSMVPRQVLNDENACFIRQVLRVAGTPEERLKIIKDGVEQAVSGKNDVAKSFISWTEQEILGENNFKNTELVKTKIKLFQTADQFKYINIINITEAANKRYCDLHDIAYEKYIGVKRGYYSWQATFNRIIYLREQLVAGYDGWVIYLDADAYIFGQGYDIRELLDRGDGDYYFSPGGPTRQKWDINAGVFIINLGSTAGRDLVNCWYTHFLRTSEMEVRRASDWGMITDDQARLQEILRTRPDLLQRLAVVPRALFNSEQGSFIRQILRAAGSHEQRLHKLRQGVAEAVSGDQDAATAFGWWDEATVIAT